jgi:hypothetical protein
MSRQILTNSRTGPATDGSESVVLWKSVSLDGYMAGPAGELDCTWSTKRCISTSTTRSARLLLRKRGCVLERAEHTERLGEDDQVVIQLENEVNCGIRGEMSVAAHAEEGGAVITPQHG